MFTDKLGDPLILVLLGLGLALAVALLRRRRSSTHVQQATGGGQVNHDAHKATTIHIEQFHVQSFHVRRDE